MMNVGESARNLHEIVLSLFPCTKDRNIVHWVEL